MTPNKKFSGINFRGLVNNNKNKVITLDVTKTNNIFRSAKKFYTILTQRKMFGNKISRLAQNKKMQELNFAVGTKQKIPRELNFADGQVLRFAGIKFCGWSQKPRNSRNLVPAKISSFKVLQTFHIHFIYSLTLNFSLLPTTLAYYINKK